ncbi:MAG: hypothetical protein ACOC7X_06305, partial [Spirochaetota bacterium]
RSEAVTVDEEVAQEPQDEIIKYKEWLNLQKGLNRNSSGGFLSGRNSGENDLGIPTVLRGRKASGENEQ